MRPFAPDSTHPKLMAYARLAIPSGLLAVGCFHSSWRWPSTAWLMPGFILGLACLARLPSSRATFYTALGVALACYAPHLGFFWIIFGPTALLLWTLLAVWPALFALLLRRVGHRWGTGLAACVLPILWTGLEYFRCEVWPLRFTWLSAGYAFSEAPQVFRATNLGVYGVGFLLAVLAAPAWAGRGPRRGAALAAAWLVAAALMAAPFGDEPRREASPMAGEAKRSDAVEDPGESVLEAVGLQMEYPFEPDLLEQLDKLAAERPDAQLVVLSEYTLQGPPSDDLLNWCRRHRRHLIVGGKDPLPEDHFYNTAFVVDPDGQVVFRQAKSVPIQFFQDGQPAATQEVWRSPWGRIGLAICYDLSYRRVMDRLVDLDAQFLIIPTVDDTTWGEAEHRLHARIARVRASEYGLPVFRVGSSGISQLIEADGRELASAPFPGQGERIEARIVMPERGRLPLDRHGAPVVCALTGLLIAAAALPAKSLPRRVPDLERLITPPDPNPESIAPTRG